jgi:hypothetical protein
LWENFYGELSTRAAQGLYGSIISRTEAQVLRIALIYAVLDKSIYIRLPHLKAAIEVWRYCDESARYIFDDCIRDEAEEIILNAIRFQSDGMTQTEISRLFSGHRKGAQLQQALRSLQQQGLISAQEKGTKGRAALVWFAT